MVEDNDEVRAYSTMVLSELGYTVLEAPEVEAALKILRSEQRIDLLFTDVVLPGRSGRVLADAAKELRPGLKCCSRRAIRATRLCIRADWTRACNSSPSHLHLSNWRPASGTFWIKTGSRGTAADAVSRPPPRPRGLGKEVTSSDQSHFWGHYMP